MPPLALLQAAVAAVWLYEGLWCKLLGRMPHQFEVVGAVPMFDGRSAGRVLRAIGAAECALAVWVLSGRLPLAAAAVQTGLLVAMNSGGLLWARRFIPDPGGMVVKNFAFLVLAWVAAVRAAGG
jgi:hypothetical protein